MLKVRAIKIEVNTNHGPFGAEYKFTNGLNIIRADNTTGKSTLFQAILYGLGMEQLLDGQNEKTMQAVLKDTVEYPSNEFHYVISSFVYLEIENKEIITTRRSVKQEGRSGKLIDVFSGSLIVNQEKDLPVRPMYVHDPGGASNELYGFHAFLEEFFNWKLPEVPTTSGDLRKLYIQSIFPSFIIEQKSGWSDFLATVPFLGLRNVKNRLVEFLLGLDVFDLEIKKQELLQRKQIIVNKWKNLHRQTLLSCEKGGVNIDNLSDYPEVLSQVTPIRFYMLKKENNISLIDYYDEEKLELSILEEQPIKFSKQKDIELIQVKLKEAEEKLEKVSIAFDMVSTEISLEKRKLDKYQRQLIEVEDELIKNKGAKKVYELGSNIPIRLADGICPTCNQEVKDTLLPQELEQTPMRIDENIKYLEAQKRMIVAYLNAHKDSINKKTRLYNNYNLLMNEDLRPTIRNLKRELVEDIRTPSEIEIEKKLKYRARVKFYGELIEELFGYVSDFQELSDSWAKILNEIERTPKDSFSRIDKQKMQLFEESFKRLVSKFGYRSKPPNAIKISLDSYLPEIQGDQMRYNIRFDSSASDLIRSIWAYTCSFLNVSDGFPNNTNHPRFLAFDEPAQQNMANADFRSFLQELSNYKNCQILVFASFNQSQELYEETTKGIDFTLHWIKERLIKPLDV